MVKLDKKLGLGDLSCKVCGQKFQTGINCRAPSFYRLCCSLVLTDFISDLSAAVDVYSDWVDACDAVAKDTANQYGGAMNSQVGNSKQDVPAEAGHGDAYEDEDY